MTRRFGAAFTVAVCLFVLAPLLIVVAVSFNAGGYTYFPPHGLSFRWYAAVLDSADWRGSIWVSLRLGAATAVVSSVVGLLAALALHRGRIPGSQAFTLLFLSPLVFPEILLGIGLLYFFRVIEVNGSATSLLLGHVLISLPYTVRLILTALPTVSAEVEDAARALGAAPWTVTRTITLPLIRPAIISGALFAFLASFDNVIISLFLATSRTVTLPVRIFSFVEYSTDASVAAVSTMFIAVTMLVLAAAARFGGVTMMRGSQ